MSRPFRSTLLFSCLLILLLACDGAQAHKASDSYLHLSVQERSLQGRWDIALRDLQGALTLDADRDGVITWGELRARHADIAAYALAHLTLASANQPCVIKPGPQLLEQYSDGAYTVLMFSADCVQTPQVLDVGYQLFFGTDRQHRGFMRLENGGQTHSALFAPDQRTRSLPLAIPDRLRQFTDYLRAGIWHIAIGYDHILFLLALLLPVVLQRHARGWQPVERMRTTLGVVFRIVTAFTLAHSLTLSLAATGVLHLPSRWVESAIAASVLLTAIDNLVPLFRCPRVWIALGFGLVHGFGFATVLGELGLPADARLLSLLAFNLGVEAGQLLIVSALLPPLFGLRRARFYPRAVLGAGSLVTAGMAVIWLVERAADVTVLPAWE